MANDCRPAIILSAVNIYIRLKHKLHETLRAYNCHKSHWGDNQDGTLFSWLHIYYAHLSSVRFEHSVCRGSLMTTLSIKVWNAKNGTAIFMRAIIRTYCLSLVRSNPQMTIQYNIYLTSSQWMFCRIMKNKFFNLNKFTLLTYLIWSLTWV